MKEKYYHFRLKDYDMVTGKWVLWPKSGVTLCILTPDEEKGETGDIIIGAAVCSEQDTYCKKRGRLIARGRAEHSTNPDFRVRIANGPSEPGGYEGLRIWAMALLLRHNKWAGHGHQLDSVRHQRS